MIEKINEKIKLIEKYNSYDARFIVKVLKVFYLKQKEFEKNKNINKIVTKNNYINEKDKYVIDLDKIWAKPYFYTRMRIRLETLTKKIINISNEDIIKNSSKIFKKVIFNSASSKFEKPEDKIDIVDFIKKIDDEKTKRNIEDYIFIAREIDEETIFKEEQIQKALQIIKIDDIKERYSLVYDEVCSYLDKDFLSNQYCDFQNNKCIAQRKHKLYPVNRKNGCCFMIIRKCPNLDNGKCTINCIGCKLFSCKFLTKRGIGYWADEIVLLKSFFSTEQRKKLLFYFYKPKEKVLHKVQNIIKKDE